MRFIYTGIYKNTTADSVDQDQTAQNVQSDLVDTVRKTTLNCSYQL